MKPLYPAAPTEEAIPLRHAGGAPYTEAEALAACRASRGRARMEYHGPRPLLVGNPSDWTGRVLTRND